VRRPQGGSGGRSDCSVCPNGGKLDRGSKGRTGIQPQLCNRRAGSERKQLENKRRNRKSIPNRGAALRELANRVYVKHDLPHSIGVTLHPARWQAQYLKNVRGRCRRHEDGCTSAGRASG